MDFVASFDTYLHVAVISIQIHRDLSGSRGVVITEFDCSSTEVWWWKALFWKIFSRQIGFGESYSILISSAILNEPPCVIEHICQNGNFYRITFVCGDYYLAGRKFSCLEALVNSHLFASDGKLPTFEPIEPPLVLQFCSFCVPHFFGRQSWKFVCFRFQDFINNKFRNLRPMVFQDEQI